MGTQNCHQKVTTLLRLNMHLWLRIDIRSGNYWRAMRAKQGHTPTLSAALFAILKIQTSPSRRLTRQCHLYRLASAEGVCVSCLIL